jgi:GNAT superfamily N-acetyltransferase
MGNMHRPLLLLSVLLVFLSSPSQSLLSNTVRTKIRVATLPNDLAAIQDCRRSAFKGKTNLLSAEESFCNADQIQKEGFICIIAKAKDGMVLGTADLSTRRNIVNNVYVREEGRKQGIARLMMEAVEEEMEKPSTLKLTVMSKNIPAISLYRKLGFQAQGVYGGLDALSSVTPFNFLMEMEKKVN